MGGVVYDVGMFEDVHSNGVYFGSLDTILLLLISFMLASWLFCSLASFMLVEYVARYRSSKRIF